MDSEDRETLLIVFAILLLVIVLPLSILEAPWLLALAMLLGAWYWWQTGGNPVSATLDTVRRERETESRAVPEPGGDDPLSALRKRYARGEIGDEEFDHRLERLLETEPEELDRERERLFDR
ncbi:SHOCT domain-containing protein [Halalkalicoccus sp. NIPERK01]|uniref:SHOCT domain-containing protein n=1 Tax=Halalkalicoccus sp. NIPERK01 TaxID=3053469 RepID=UPI00256F48FB|nr:SHOCT domain-containing protein [Halalkalicoccus sp. NIPERK01]MDL5361419.1 SHOCT domain-containing protein [Halalkalicoccus sp. NIPERK01]